MCSNYSECQRPIIIIYFQIKDTKLPTIGQKAKLESEIFSGSIAPTCVEFWYHMYSTSTGVMGDLNVWKLNKNDDTYTLLWTLSLSQGNSWYEGRFSYVHLDYHTIVFEGFFCLKIIKNNLI